MSEKDTAFKRYVAYVSNKKANLQDWLDEQPNVSAVIVLALEMYRAQQTGDAKNQGVDIEEIRQVMREELAQVSFTNGASVPRLAEGDEAPDVMQGMDVLVGTWDFDDDEEADG